MDIAAVRVGLERNEFEQIEIRLKSPVWQYFNKLLNKQSKQILNFVLCTKCDAILNYVPANGTSALLRHTKNCPREIITTNAEEIAAEDQTELPEAIQSSIKKDFSTKLVKWCAQDLRPFEIVDDCGFREIAQELVELGSKMGKFNVTDVLPSSRTVSRTTTEEYGRVMKDVVKGVTSALTEGNLIILFLIVNI